MRSASDDIQTRQLSDSKSGFGIASPAGVSNCVLNRIAPAALHDMYQRLIQGPSGTPMKIGCNYSGRTADTGSAMNVHRVSLTQQVRQRGYARGKTSLQVGSAEGFDRNTVERQTSPSRRQPFRLDPAFTSVLFILQAENSSDLQRLQVLEILVVAGIWSDPKIGLDRRAGHPQDHNRCMPVFSCDSCPWRKSKAVALRPD